MIWSLDSSSDAPSLDQARAAKAAGIGFWWGYLATKPDVGLEAPWSELAFWNVLQAGLGCGAFVSGWDDPGALRQLAQVWGIHLLALDDEDGIRPLTQPDWRPAFLAAAGAGHYGLQERLTIPAPFRIAALYPAGGCTGATWPTSPPPAMPHGWQCQGTHTEFGRSVDRAALDDWFGGDTVDQATFDALVAANPALSRLNVAIVTGVEDPNDKTQFAKTVEAYLEGIPALEQAVAALAKPDPAALGAAIAAQPGFVSALAAAILAQLDLVQRPQSTPPTTTA